MHHANKAKYKRKTQKIIKDKKDKMSICIQNGPEMLVLTSDRFHYEHILFHCFFTRQAEVSNTRYMYIGMPRFYGI